MSPSFLLYVASVLLLLVVQQYGVDASQFECQSNTCPVGYTPINSSGHRSCSPDPSCTIDMCCFQNNKRCRLYDCAAVGMIRNPAKRGSSCGRPCPASHCCMKPRTPKPTCTLFHCPARTHRLRPTAIAGGRGTSSCTGVDGQCTATDCCGDNPTCDMYQCPTKNHHQRSGADSITCADRTCQTHECCNANPRCGMYQCPFGMHAYGHAHVKTCRGKMCTDNDCCVVNPKCNMFTCPRLMRLVKRPHLMTCRDAQCSSSDCCVANPRCNSFLCVHNSHPVPNAAAKVCSGNGHCSRNECCLPNQTCGAFRCPHGKQLRRESMNLLCNQPVCTVLECCKTTPTCSPRFDCPVGTHIIADATSKQCRDGVCSSYECCTLNQTCRSYSCPTNMNLVLRANGVRCSESGCTDMDCCNPNAFCSADYQCAVGYTLVDLSSTTPHVCAKMYCSDTDCCVKDSPAVAKPVCSLTYQCADGYTRISDNDNDNTAAAAECASNVCVDSDCCVASRPPTPCTLSSNAVGQCVAAIDCPGLSRVTNQCTSSSSSVCCVTSATTTMPDGRPINACQFVDGRRGLCAASSSCKGTLEHNRCPVAAAHIKCCVDDTTDELNATLGGLYATEAHNHCAAFCAQQSNHASISLTCTDACRNDACDVDVNDADTTSMQHTRVAQAALAGCAFQHGFAAGDSSSCREQCTVAGRHQQQSALFVGVCTQLCERAIHTHRNDNANDHRMLVCADMCAKAPTGACFQSCGFAAGQLRRALYGK